MAYRLARESLLLEVLAQPLIQWVDVSMSALITSLYVKWDTIIGTYLLLCLLVEQKCQN